MMPFRNLEIPGTGKNDINAKFDPINQVLHTDAYFPRTELIANYTARLNFRKNNTVLEEAGTMRMCVVEYHVTDMRVPIRYSSAAGKFQIDYPTHLDINFLNRSFEMTGLKNAATGEAVSGQDMLKLTVGYEKPGFMSIWIAITNFNMQVQC